MLRVVVVEDSPVARDLIVEILNSAPDISVVGVAKNGLEGVELVHELRPDVVTMDVQMPRMDGYEATREIMITRPTPIVVVSGSTERPDIDKSIRSLQAGALTVVGKPHAPTSPGFEGSSKLLVDTVRSMSQVKVVRQYRNDQPGTRETKDAAQVSMPSGRTRIVAMAASTGGPQTVHQILSGLPADFSIPIVYVQHISDGFGEGLASWLNSTTPLHVRVAKDGEPLEAGTVHVGPEGHHLGVSRNHRIALSTADPVGGFRPAATILFESAAQVYREQLLAVQLTGMGRDGVDGLKAVRQFGGRIVTQNEESCIVYGMPKAAVDEGVSDAVLNPAEIIQQLIQLQPTPA